jgi:hypothetical protein
MKKFLIVLSIALVTSAAFAAKQTLDNQDATKTGLTSLVSKINAMMTELYGSVSTNSADRLAALEVIATNAALVATELDAASATALLLGKATATSVTIGASDAGVSIPGTLGVTGAFTGSSTVAATGYKIGAVAGFSGIVTNLAPGGTNFIYYGGGIVTNKVFTAE